MITSQSIAPSPTHLEELDLAIPDMNSVFEQIQVKEALESLPGIRTLQIIERGASIHFNPLGISVFEICTAIRRAGFRASTFHDSEGHTGKSSQ